MKYQQRSLADGHLPVGSAMKPEAWSQQAHICGRMGNTSCQSLMRLVFDRQLLPVSPERRLPSFLAVTKAKAIKSLPGLSIAFLG